MQNGYPRSSLTCSFSRFFTGEDGKFQLVGVVELVSMISDSTIYALGISSVIFLACVLVTFGIGMKQRLDIKASEAAASKFLIEFEKNLFQRKRELAIEERIPCSLKPEPERNYSNRSD